MLSSAVSYVADGGWSKIPGAVGLENLKHVLLFAQFQEEQGIIGDVGEIGVFKGRLLTLLHLLSRPNEKVLAIDAFEDLSKNFDTTGGATSSLEVITNLRPFVGETGIERLHLVHGDSLYVNPEHLRKYMSHDGLRMFSIDGGHSWYHTSSDLRLADTMVQSGGIVILDDITNAGWPGVMDGLARYLLLNPTRRLFPFMIGHNKLWLTTPDFHERYFELAWSRAEIFPGQMKRRSEFFGSAVVGF